MSLSDKQLKNRCLLGAGGRQCRYLEGDPHNYKLFNCLKKVSGKKKAIDAKIAKHIADCKKAGIDPAQNWTPCADGGSCPGYLYLPTVKQGYDVTNP